MFDVYKPGVYRITFPDGFFYIGSAWSKKGICGRWREHESGGNNSPVYLQEYAKKHGGWKSEWFEILENVLDGEDPLIREESYLQLHKDNPFLLNLNFKPRHPPSPWAVDAPLRLRINALKAMSGDNNPAKRPEVRKKISESKMGEKNSNFGKHPTKETLEKMSKAARGRKCSEETRKKISESKMGAKNPNGSGEANSFFGHRHTEETKILLSILSTGRFVGEKSPLSKISNSDRDRVCKLYETGEYSQRELGEMFGVAKSTINRIIKEWR